MGFSWEDTIWDLLDQIPEGTVTTYGDIARSLGDVRASRAVGMTLSRNDRPVERPCHRVIYSDGRVGWYLGKGRGMEYKEELLSNEGLAIKDGKVEDLKRVRFTAFRCEPILTLLIEEQELARDGIVMEDDFSTGVISGLDVAYSKDTAFAARVDFDMETGEEIDVSTVIMPVTFPYIPGYLAFKEMPIMKELLVDDGRIHMIDGNGILHPRGCGIASQLGVEMGVCTMGVAKSLLCGSEEGGSISFKGRKVGSVLETGSRKAYVSVGNRISLDTATAIARRFLGPKGPLPVWRAHQEAERAKRSAATF